MITGQPQTPRHPCSTCRKQRYCLYCPGSGRRRPTPAIQFPTGLPLKMCTSAIFFRVALLKTTRTEREEAASTTIKLPFFNGTGFSKEGPETARGQGQPHLELQGNRGLSSRRIRAEVGGEEIGARDPSEIKNVLFPLISRAASRASHGVSEYSER